MRISYLICISMICMVCYADSVQYLEEYSFEVKSNESKQICLQGSTNPLDIWNVLIVNVTTNQGLPSFTIDSYDSSIARAITYVYELITGNKGFNSNAFYDKVNYRQDWTTEIFLSPYSTSCFNITCPKSWKVDNMIVDIKSIHAFDNFCLIRLMLGIVLLIFSSKLSKSKSFYYITAASLSAVMGVLLIIFYFMKRMQASNTAMGTVAVAYSVGLTSLFRRSCINWIFEICIEHYRVVGIYIIVFAFIGIVIVRLKIFNSSSTNHTSLFEVVRWALVLVSLSLILTSTASVIGSLISFVVVMVLLELMKSVFNKLYINYKEMRNRSLIMVNLRYKFFPPKHVFKTMKQYEEDKQKYTVQEMKKLRQYYLNHPDVLEHIESCPKATMVQFLTTGIDIIDTTTSLQDLVKDINSMEKEKSTLSGYDDSHLDYLYHKRNDSDVFLRNGEYTQASARNIAMTDADAMNSLRPNGDDMYKDDYEDYDDYSSLRINRKDYEYDSDEGRTSFFIPKQPPRATPKKARRPQRMPSLSPSSDDDDDNELRNRRTTLPSSYNTVPTLNTWIG